MSANLSNVAEIRAQIERDIAWYEAKGRSMKTSEHQLAFALVIGATKALTELLDRLPASRAAA